MQSRKIRVPATGIGARLGPGKGELINVSLSGALVRLDAAVTVGSDCSLQLSLVEVGCRVVRCTPSQDADHPGVTCWMVAVVFGDVTGRAAKALRELVASMYERVGASRV